jgi:hypothetical protein
MKKCFTVAVGTLLLICTSRATLAQSNEELHKQIADAIGVHVGPDRADEHDQRHARHFIGLGH